jgi:hypothetical protein
MMKFTTDKMKKRIILSVIIAVPLLVLLYFYKSALNYLSDYLSKSEKVEANVLVVEGWLPEYAVDMSLNEFKNGGYDYILTTGLKYFDEYFELSENGYLIFTPKDLKGNTISKHTIEVDAAGSLNGDHSAHFFLLINKKVVADFWADKHKRRFAAEWNGELGKIENIMIQFANDNVDEVGDINLYVKDVVIDHNVVIPYLNNSIFDMSALDGDGVIINNFNSVAEKARNRLLALGIDSAKVIAVPGKKVIINRTLTSALAFKSWLSKNNLNIEGINIFSMGTHARRTWLTYNKVLGQKYRIGIISVPDYQHDQSGEIKLIKTLRESVGIIYYWIILIPYGR